MDEEKLIRSMKANSILLDEVKEGKICKFIKARLKVNSCVVCNCSFGIFKLKTSREEFWRFIEPCFAIVAEIKDVLELNFVSLVKILSSSGLNIESELQVFNAADSWLCHDITERSKYAKELLLTVRLPLLSVHALKQILEKVSTFSIDDKCVSIMKTNLMNKKQLNSKSCNMERRYCNQTNFHVLVCGGRRFTAIKSVTDVKYFDANNFSKANFLPQMGTARRGCKVVCNKGKVYVFGGFDNNFDCVKSIEIII